MKKMMMLVCVLGLATMVYAESPVLTSFGYATQQAAADSTQKRQEKAQKEATANAIKKAAEQGRKAAAQKAAKAAQAIGLLSELRDANGKAVFGDKLKQRYDYMIAQIEELNGSDFSAQSAVYAMEDFASYVISSTRSNPNALFIVKSLLSKCMVKVRTETMFLKAAAKEVTDAGIQAGNGQRSAGLNEEATAFYNSL